MVYRNPDKRKVDRNNLLPDPADEVKKLDKKVRKLEQQVGPISGPNQGGGGGGQGPPGPPGPPGAPGPEGPPGAGIDPELLDELMGTVIPRTPRDVQLTADTNGDVYLEWVGSYFAVGYRVYRNGLLLKVVPDGSGQSEPLFSTKVTGPTSAVQSYAVSAYSLAGESGRSDEVWLNGGPTSAPTGVTAAMFEGDKVKVSFNPSYGASGYYLYRGSGAGGGVLAQVSAGSPIIDTPPEDGMYYYQVSAFNRDGETARSSVAAIGYYTLPTPPTSVSTSMGFEREVIVSWSGASRATSYQVHRSSTGAVGSYLLLAVVSGTSFSDTTIPADGTYFYRVAAANKFGTSAHVNSFPTVVKMTPDAPTGVAASWVSVGGVNGAYNGYVELEWNPSPGVSGYRVYLHGGVLHKVVGPGVNGAVIDWVVAGRPWGPQSFGVSSFNAYGESPIVYATAVIDPLPSAVYPSVTEAPGDSITVSWDRGYRAEGYRVYRSFESGPYILRFVTLGTEFTDTSFPSDGNYSYLVKAHNGHGEGEGYTTSADVTRLPSSPTSPSATWNRATGTVEVRWNHASRADGYYVYRRVGTSGSFLLVQATASNGFTDRNVWTAEAHNYYIVAYNRRGMSAASSTVAATPSFGLPRTPDDLDVRRSGGNVFVSFQRVPGAVGYRVYYDGIYAAQVTDYEEVEVSGYPNPGLWSVSSYNLKGESAVSSQMHA